MAEVSQRTWKRPGKPKRKAWGFTVQVNGRQVKHYRAEWTQDDAERALAEITLGITTTAKPQTPGLTFGQAAERYLQLKARKRSVDEDRRILEHLKVEFGAETPLTGITAGRISEYRGKRLGVEKSKRGEKLSAASINRPLALLRHLLRLAHEEWEVLAIVPKIRLEKEPEGRIRWLEPDEEHRLLTACRASRTKHLAAVVTVALESGLRKGELLGLTWDRVDFSRGVIRLEITKSGKRREVPMRQVVDDILSGVPETMRHGRVWRAEGLRAGWERAVEDAKLDDFHFHDCRHHFASWYMMRGGSLKALQEVLGHADIKMTMKYAHLSPDHLRAEMLKTERPAATMVTPQPAARSAQASAQEPVSEVLGVRK